MDYKTMKELAKENGINPVGKSIPQLTALLADKGIDVNEEAPAAKAAPAKKTAPVKAKAKAAPAVEAEAENEEAEEQNPIPGAEAGTDKPDHVTELAGFSVKQLTAVAVEMNEVMGLDPAIPLSKNAKTLATDIHHEATAEEVMPVDFGIGAKKSAKVFTRATAEVFSKMSDVVKKLKPEIKALYPDLFPKAEKAPKAAKAVKAAKAEKAPKAAKAPKEPKVKKPTRVEITTRVLLENPKITDENELAELIATAGDEVGLDRNDKETKTYHIPRCRAVLAIAAEFYSK